MDIHNYNQAMMTDGQTPKPGKSFADWLDEQPEDDLNATIGTMPDEAPLDRHARLKSETGGKSETFKDKCPKCGGSGAYRGYSSRGNKCFACKGRGFKEFKTSPEHRAAQRQKKADKLTTAATAFKEAHPHIAQWIAAKYTTFGFAASMDQAITKYGSLTDGQIAAVERCIASDAVHEERKAQWAREREEKAAAALAERIAREAAAPTVTISAIEEAFGVAKGSGIKYPKLRLDTFVFSPAPAHGKNAGAIYVKEGEDYLGKIVGGKFLRVQLCNDEQERRIVAAAADPKAAAIAYGKKFGSCCICGRELSNPASVELGIGPICASRFGWGG